MISLYKIIQFTVRLHQAWIGNSNGLGTLLVVADSSVFNDEDLVGNVEVAVVVANDEHCLAATAQIRKKLLVEEISERWVLIGGPLVKNKDWPILQQRDHHG